jgi:nucleoside-diphosphate-sugar epimerase
LGVKPFSFIHAGDLADFLFRVQQSGERITMTSDPNGRAPVTGQGLYYAACGEDVPYTEFGRMVGKALGRSRVHVVRCPGVLVTTLGLINETCKRVFKCDVALDRNKAHEALLGPWICCPAKGNAQLDFSPQKSLQERLNQTADWYAEMQML